MMQYRGNYAANKLSTPYNINKKKWGGSGTCIIEHNYFNRINKKVEDTIFLFYNPFTKYFELPYGAKESYDQTPKDTAYRETKEESANLFDIRGALHTINCMISHGGKQHLFVVRLIAPPGGINSRLYYNNLHKIKNSYAPHVWYELNGITRISVSELVNIYTSKPVNVNNIEPLNMKDIYGNNIQICKRDTLLLQYLIQKKFHTNTKPMKCHFVPYYGKKQFLKGTYSYKI